MDADLSRKSGAIPIAALFAILLSTMFVSILEADGILPPFQNWTAGMIGNPGFTATESGTNSPRTVNLESDGVGFSSTEDSIAIFRPNDNPSAGTPDIRLKLAAPPVPVQGASLVEAEAGLIAAADLTDGTPFLFFGINGSGNGFVKFRSHRDGEIRLQSTSIESSDTLRLVAGFDAVYLYRSPDLGSSWQSLGGFPIAFGNLEPVVGATAVRASVTIQDLSSFRMPLFFEISKDEEEATFIGEWEESTQTEAWGGSITGSTVENGGIPSAAFDLTPPVSGAYEVFLRWHPMPESSPDTPVNVAHSSVEHRSLLLNDLLAVDQTGGSGLWVSLGTYWLDREALGQQLTLFGGAPGPGGAIPPLSLDAIRIVKGHVSEPVLWTELQYAIADHSGELDGSAVRPITLRDPIYGGPIDEGIGVNGSGNYYVAIGPAEPKSLRSLHSDGEVSFSTSNHQQVRLVDSVTSDSYAFPITLPEEQSQLSFQRAGTTLRLLRNGVAVSTVANAGTNPLAIETTLPIEMGEPGAVALGVTDSLILGAVRSGDVDEDGLSDAWEFDLAMHPSAPSKGIYSILDVLGKDDFDGDGRTNTDELTDWTDPADPLDFRVFRIARFDSSGGIFDDLNEDERGCGLRRIRLGTDWTAAGMESRVISGDGAIQFTVSASSSPAVVGLTYSTPPTAPTETRTWSLTFLSDGNVSAVTGEPPPLSSAVIGTHEPGDRFMVARSGNSIEYWKNGQRLQTYPLSPTDAVADLSAIVRIQSSTESPALSGILVDGGALPRDLDEDGLFDEFENGIIAARIDDSVATLEHVAAGDDFDEDFASNFREQHHHTVPTSATSKPGASPVTWNDSAGVAEAESFTALGIRKFRATDAWDSIVSGRERISFIPLSGANADAPRIAFTVGARGHFAIGLAGDADIRSGSPENLAFGLTFAADGTFQFANGDVFSGPGGGTRSTAEIVGANIYEEGDRFEIKLTKTPENGGSGSTSYVYRFEVLRNGTPAGSRVVPPSTEAFGAVAAFRTPTAAPSVWAVDMVKISHDSDEDGIPDVWENWAISLIPSDALQSLADVRPWDDPDGDGRSNWVEFLDGTNPTNPFSFSTFEPVFWTNMAGTDEAPHAGYPRSALRKIIGSSQVPGGALSQQVLKPTGPTTVRFRVEQIADFDAGFQASDRLSSYGFNTMVSCLRFSEDGTFQGFRTGTLVSLTGQYTTMGHYQRGDHFAIEAAIISGIRKILIRKNGSTVYEQSVTGFESFVFGVKLMQESPIPAITEATVVTVGTQTPVPADQDRDGLPDAWEFSRFINVPNPRFASIEDVIGSVDSDGDGRSNSEEFSDWSDPLNPLEFKLWQPVKWNLSGSQGIAEDGYQSEAFGHELRSTLRSMVSSTEWATSSYARGLRSISGNGGVRFRIMTPIDMILGLHPDSSSVPVYFPSGLKMDHFLLFHPSGTFQVYQDTTRVSMSNGYIGQYAVGDEFSIERKGALCEVFQNGKKVAEFDVFNSGALSARVHLKGASETPQISGVREFGAVLPGDLDEDGLPDTWEQQIIDADTFDQLTSIQNVGGRDDFDGDGVPNEVELLDDTDPVDPLDRFRAIVWKEETLVASEYPADGARFESGSLLRKYGGAENWGVSTAISRDSLPGDGSVQFAALNPGQKARIKFFNRTDPTRTPVLILRLGGDAVVPGDEIKVEHPTDTGYNQVASFELESEVAEVIRTGSNLTVRRRSRTDDRAEWEVIYNRTFPLAGDLVLEADILTEGGGLQHFRTLGFSDPLDRDGDGIPDADEVTFMIDSGYEDSYFSDGVGLSTDIDGDGRTAGEELRFGPEHFSKHPDLRLGAGGRATPITLPTNLTNDPIRSLGGSFSVDQGGAATYSIPIPLPPGTAGMVPSLSVGYSSHAGNGLLGVGWSLNGLSAITRGGSNHLHDGFRDPLDGDLNDRFFFGASRLVLVSGTYGMDGSEYRTETDRFSRFVYRRPQGSRGSWQVFDRTGVILSFGSSVDSNIRRDIGGAPTTVAWCLKRVEDRSGNYYEVSYEREMDGQHVVEFVPSEIRYTGNLHAGVAPYVTVAFVYEDRPNDASEGYFAPAGSPRKAAQTKRLAEIQVSTGDYLNRKLEFSYQTSPANGESRLVSVREYANDGSTYSPTQFEWETPDTGWTRSNEWSATKLSDPKFGDKGRRLVDLNGDSLPDLVGSHAIDSNTKDVVVELNTGKGFVANEDYRLPEGVYLSSESPDENNPEVIEFGGTGAMFVDLNGDALPDLVSNGRFHWDQWYVEPREEVVFNSAFSTAPNTWPRKVHHQATTYYWKEPIVDTLGRNIGLRDRSFPAQQSRRLSNGTWTMTPYPPLYNGVIWLTLHRVQYKDNKKGVWINTGKGWQLAPADGYGAIADPDPANPLHVVLGDSEIEDNGVRFLDLDGDGLMDLIGDGKVLKNSGNGWIDISESTWALPSPVESGHQFIDMNGDGLVDLVRGISSGGSGSMGQPFESDLWLNTGSGWEHQPDWELPTWLADHTGAPCGRDLHDLNGDGLPDLIASSASSSVPPLPSHEFNEVWLNTGSGWEALPSFRLPLPLVSIDATTGKSRPLGRMFSDVNGDGLVDFVSVGEMNSRGVWLNTGKGWSAKDARWSIPDGFTVGATGLGEAVSSFQLADIDGDGLPDFMDRSGSAEANRGIWLNRAAPERVGRFLAPLADPIRVTYTRMNDPSPLPETGKRVHQVGRHARYPHVDTETSQDLVSKVTTWDDRNREQSVVYSYGGLRFDQRGRGSLGFRWMQVTDYLRGFSTYTEFLQDFPHTGMVSFSESRLPDGRPLSRIRNHYEELPEKGNLPGGGGSIVYPYLRSSVSSVYTVDSGGSEHHHMGTTRTVSTLDEWGNLRTSQVDFHTSPDVDENSVPLKSTRIVHHYEQEDPAKWMIGRITRTTTRVTSNEVGLEGEATIERTSTTEYDPVTGLPLAQTNLPGESLSSRTEFRYDLFGNVRKTIKTAADETRQITQETFYDRTGRFAERTLNSLGHRASMAFHFDRGVPRHSVDANGLQTDFHHDVWGDLVKTSFADGTASVSVRKWLNQSRIPAAVFYSYQQSSGTTPTVIYHDRYGRTLLVETLAFQGKWSNYAETLFDRYGRAFAVSEPYTGNPTRKYWSTSHYDLLDRVVEVRAPDGRAAKTHLNGFTTTSTNALGQKTRGVTDWFGRAVSTTDPLGGKTSFLYDIDGNLAHTTDVSGNFIKATFNRLGLRTFLSDPHAGSTTSVYNGFGELRSTTDNLGNESSFTYDSLGRAATRTTPEGRTVYTYDTATGKGLGKLHQIALTPIGDTADYHPHGMGYTEVHTYDDYGRSKNVTFTVHGVTYQTSQTYDGLGRPEDSTDAGGFTTRVHYNAHGHAYETVRANNGALLSRTDSVDAKGRVVSSKAGNGVETYRSYNALTGFLTHQGTSKSNAIGTSITPIQRFSYQYDALGNLRSRTDDRLTGTDPVETFLYDGLNRLESATVAGQATQVFTYGENGAGNLSSRNGISDYRYHSPGRPHRLTSALDHSNTERVYLHDDRGRTTHENRRVGSGPLAAWRDYSWTSFEMPRIINHYQSPVLTEGRVGGFPTSRGLAQARFTYDAHFSRTSQIVMRGGRIVRTLYLGSYEVVETREYMSNTAFEAMPLLEREKKHHFGNGVHRIVETSENGGLTTTPVANTLYSHGDHLGSITAITDGSGVLVERLSFDSFGSRRKGSDWGPDSGDGNTPATAAATALNTTRGYTGHEQLDHFGLVHMNGRIYDPEIGRFLSPDPLVSMPGNSQSYNRYAYVLNNPHRYTDPSGYSPVYTLPTTVVESSPSGGGSFTIPHRASGLFAGGGSPQIGFTGGGGGSGGVGGFVPGYPGPIFYPLLPPGYANHLIAQQRQAARDARAEIRRDRLRERARQSLAAYHAERRQAMILQPVQERSEVMTGLVASSNDGAPASQVVGGFDGGESSAWGTTGSVFLSGLSNSPGLFATGYRVWNDYGTWYDYTGSYYQAIMAAANPATAAFIGFDEAANGMGLQPHNAGSTLTTGERRMSAVNGSLAAASTIGTAFGLKASIGGLRFAPAGGADDLLNQSYRLGTGADRAAILAHNRAAYDELIVAGGKISSRRGEQLYSPVTGKPINGYIDQSNYEIVLGKGSNLSTLTEELIHFRQAQRYTTGRIPHADKNLMEIDAAKQLQRMGFIPE